MTSPVSVRLFAIIFFLSGATFLLYQVAWMRKLSLFFGSDVYSAPVATINDHSVHTNEWAQVCHAEGRGFEPRRSRHLSSA
jgi:hypothetical protein